MNKEQAVTTTDTLKLYGELHADVPETKCELPCVSGLDQRSPFYPACVALCRCAALEWACKARRELDTSLPPYIVSRESLELMTWLTTGASSDSRLIDICRAIHAAKGKTK